MNDYQLQKIFLNADCFRVESREQIYPETCWEFQDYQKADVIVKEEDSKACTVVRGVRFLPNSGNTLDLSDIIKSLEFMEKLPAEEKEIHYYSHSVKDYISCGKSSLPSNKIIPLDEFPIINKIFQIQLKLTQPTLNLKENLILPIEKKDDCVFEEKMQIEDNQLEIVNDQSTDIDNEESRGTFDSISLAKQPSIAATQNFQRKDKKIKNIVEVVTRWRNLYNGFVDPETGKQVNMRLDEAAKVVGMPKKSLDDYLLQIRYGRKFGFDFVANGNEGIGLLRAFVKKHKIYNRNCSGSVKNSNLAPEVDCLLEKRAPKRKQKESLRRKLDGGISTRSKKISK